MAKHFQYCSKRWSLIYGMLVALAHHIVEISWAIVGSTKVHVKVMYIYEPVLPTWNDAEFHLDFFG